MTAQPATTTFIDRCRDAGVPDTVTRVAERVKRHRIKILASHIAFRLVFAVFPGLIAFLWLLEFLNAGGLVNDLLDLIATVMPTAAEDRIKEQLTSAPEGQSRGSLNPGVLLSALVAVWAVSSAFRAMMDALDVIFECPNRRSTPKRFLISFGAALGIAALLVVALILVVSGRKLAAGISEAVAFDIAASVAVWVVAFLVVTFAVMLTYFFAPATENKVRWLSKGAILAAVAWLIFSALFSLYVNVLSNPQDTYGALAGVAVTMLYVYVSTFIILLGAEVNALEAGAPKGLDGP